MTNQETIANLNMISVAFVEPVTKEQRKLIDDTFEMAIKALEQEPILDKVRAEIEQIEINGHIRDVECFNAGVNTVLNIIDKYRQEG